MILPRVTEILRCFNGYDKVDERVLDNAATRGKMVHAICAGVAQGIWVPDEFMHNEHIGYVRSFEKWSDENVVNFPVIERRLSCDDFTGQIDFVAEDHYGDAYLVDIKTTAAFKRTHSLQVAAYSALLWANSLPHDGAKIVYLDKEGEYPKIYEYDLNELEEMFHLFTSALKLHKFFHPPKEKKDGRTTRKPRKKPVPASPSPDGGP